MIRRRATILGTIVGAPLASPAIACRAPAPKNRNGYAGLIDRLFDAWWARDYDAFQQPFQVVARPEPFDTRALFDAHYAKPEPRFRGELLFNGASVVAQVITPQEADPAHGICGGYAVAHLFLVRFFPGSETPAIDEMKHVDTDLLAGAEWGSLPGAPQ